MSNIVNPLQAEVPSDDSWVDVWIHEQDDAYLEVRKYGIDILQRIRDNLPLSPREAAMAQFKHEEMEAAQKQYTEMLGEPMYDNDIETAKVFVEGIAHPLLSMREHPEADRGQFAEIAQLSDERPHDPQQVNQQQPTEGEQ